MSEKVRQRARGVRQACRAAAVVASISVCLLSGCATYTPQDSSAVRPLLLDAEAIRAITGFKRISAETDFDYVTGHPEGWTWSDSMCLPALLSLTEQAYFRSGGYEAVAGKRLQEPPVNDVVQGVDQGIVQFPDAVSAQYFVEASTLTWDRCVGRPLVITYPNGYTGKWVPSTPVTTDEITIVRMVLEGADGYTTDHAIAARSDIVIDVTVTGYHLTDEAVRIVQVISERRVSGERG